MKSTNVMGVFEATSESLHNENSSYADTRRSSLIRPDGTRMALPEPEFDGREIPLVMCNTDEDVFWVAAITFLWSMPKVGSRTVSKIVQSWGTQDPRESLSKVDGIDLFWRARYDQIVERIRAIEEPWSLIRRGSLHYPKDMEILDSPPACLFARGDLSLLAKPSVAVVGTRKPTQEGVRRAKRLARHLVRRDIGVTSGLAAGIDTAALSAALEIGGSAIAVIGTPLDMAYPRENKQLQETIARSGLLVSQFPFFAPTDRGNFPERNRTMAAIGRATCVVEAGPTSGTRHQVEFSRRIGHPVFFMKSMAENPHDWVRDELSNGAHVLESPEQLDGMVFLS